MLPEFQVIIVYKVMNSYRNLPDTVEVFLVADSEELELLGGENPHPPLSIKLVI